jgi:hypothetical protein
MYDGGPPGHLGGIDLADRCNTPVLADLLEERDLLGYGPLVDGSLTERDTERCRIAKFIASKPEGTPLTHVVSYAIKGISPETCERVDGSDPDYQFAYRFVDDLAEPDNPYIEKSEQSGVLFVTPTLRLLDLITEGITQTGNSEGLIYDREFLRNYLSRVDSVDDSLRDLLEDGFTSYLNRIEDYRLLFDVHFLDRRGGQTDRRITKKYKTRFNDEGRVSKQFARFNDALEHGYDHAENAVLATFTTDPKRQHSLLDGIESINENFNRLLSYLASDPSTKDDTRAEGTVGWRPDLDDVTGRPRERLDYIKALEFSEKGYPHLHVLFFDVPTRDDDGMPWLCDKPELAAKWSDYGQGEIVDTYPLVYRDDLDDLDPEFQSDEGFVDWYRFGDHDHDEAWVRNRTRAHDLIEFGDDGHEMESTAGAYLGKYLSATFGSLLDATESFEEPDDEKRESYGDKAATWKLALYWATNRRFWSCSRSITEGIDPNDHTQDPDVREAVRYCALDSIRATCESSIRDDLARRSWDDLDDLGAAIECAIADVEQPQVRSTLPDEAPFRCVVDYLGAYAYWNLPSSEFGNRTPNLKHFENSIGGSKKLPVVDREHNHPIISVWN